MSRTFQCRAVPNTWLEHNGRRLDCGPYMLGAFEAKELLKKHHTESLKSLTKGHNGGIYNGPQFVRNYVEDPVHGVPFLTTSTILQSDLSNLPMISKKDAHSAKLSYLKIDEGMTLITCSGSIGRMTYARKDMIDCWSNQDIMKVVADSNKILPGYLYAYLSSRFGVPIVVSGTYGAIIQHIEPHHIANLPVPRLGAIEEEAHKFLQESASLLTEYQKKINESTMLYFDSVGLLDISSSDWHSWGADLGFATTAKVHSLRALNYNPRFNLLCERLKRGHWKTLGDLCLSGTLKRGNRFNRVDAEPEFAYKLVGQKELFWLRPEGRWIATQYVPRDVLVENGSILVAARGTLGENELYCRSEFIYGKSTKNAFSEDILRVIADETLIERGALFAFMRSETAFRLLRSISVGSKLQDHHYKLLPTLPIPLPPPSIRARCHRLIIEAYEAREKAIGLEDQARSLVERTIEGRDS